MNKLSLLDTALLRASVTLQLIPALAVRSIAKSTTFHSMCKALGLTLSSQAEEHSYIHTSKENNKS